MSNDEDILESAFQIRLKRACSEPIVANF